MTSSICKRDEIPALSTRSRFEGSDPPTTSVRTRHRTVKQRHLFIISSSQSSEDHLNVTHISDRIFYATPFPSSPSGLPSSADRRKSIVHLDSHALNSTSLTIWYPNQDSSLNSSIHISFFSLGWCLQPWRQGVERVRSVASFPREVNLSLVVGSLRKAGMLEMDRSTSSRMEWKWNVYGRSTEAPSTCQTSSTPSCAAGTLLERCSSRSSADAQHHVHMEPRFI
ncbi:hypothetical protein SCHPADRAFT_621628 [Schizopora paradoxa]|uniref:Uncharacterized protein n=1 Tax=Schizopora paradoxa TaxID=27342 RepID=A0A0H2R8C2_9AGAM|nr:hypothetical protein SCHPADRAFT_621628 [Schizopora paradoxa]